MFARQALAKFLSYSFKIFFFAVLASYFLAARESNAQNLPPRTQKRGIVPGEFIVTYKEKTVDNLAAQSTEVIDAMVPGIRAMSAEAKPSRETIRKAAVKRAGFKFLREAGRFSHVVQVDPDSVRQLSADQTDLIASIEPNYYIQPDVIPNDPKFSELWGLKNNATGNYDIDAEVAWDRFAGARDVVVGVVDTGVDYNHEDLKQNLWTNPLEIPGNGIDDDNNNIIDDVYGYSAVGDLVKNTPTAGGKEGDPYDLVGHGSHVAGTIAAVGNNSKGVIGVVGTTPRIKVMAIQIMSPTGGTSADAVAGIDYAVLMKSRGVNITVLNNSWGFTADTAIAEPISVRDAIQRARDAGIVFVASAGNGGTDHVGDNNDIVTQWPASHLIDNVISVASLDSTGGLSSYSNFGPSRVHLAAPGRDILSVKAALGNTPSTDPYIKYSGTSMAAPHVTGVVALVMSQASSMTPAQVRTHLMNNTRRLTTLSGRVASGGLLNSYASINSLAVVPVVTLSGYVRVGAVPVPNVYVSAGTHGGRYTDANGFYTITVPQGAAYTLTPIKTAHTFSPATFSGTANANAAKDFSATVGTVNVRGYIRDSITNQAIAHATVNLGPHGSTSTDSAGFYSINIAYGTNYTITPSRPYHTFSPANRSGTAIGNVDAGFSATAGAYDVSGIVRSNSGSVPLPGATVSGGSFGTQTSDANGNYQFRDVPKGSSIQLTFSKAGYFDTVMPAVTINGNQNISANLSLRTFRIRGGALTSTGAAIPGAQITLNGTSNLYTDNTGFYIFSSVPMGSYTLSVSKAGYTFNPSQYSGNITADMDIVFRASAPSTPTPTPTPVPTQYVRLSGTITAGGSNLPNVTVRAGALGTTVTNAAGGYLFQNVPKNNTYTVQPTLTGWAFTPGSSTVTMTADQVRNFAASRTLHTVSGTARVSGTPASGVSVSLSGVGTVVTGTAGTYSFANIPYSTAYTVSASKAGVVFTPSSYSGTVTTNMSHDFSGGTSTYVLSGLLRNAAGVGISGATITSAALGTATSGSTGAFSFPAKAAGTAYSISITHPGYSFSPATFSGTLNANTNHNSTGAPLNFSISGTIRVGTTPLAGVSVNAGTLGTVTTNASGVYSIPNVPFATNYNLVPTKTGYTFSPGSSGGTVNGAKVNDFAATAVQSTYTISGQVTRSGVGVAGVTLSSTLGTRTTDASGNYSYTNVPNGTVFTITPSMTGWNFSPSYVSGTISGANAVRNIVGAPINYTLTVRTLSPTGTPIAGVNIYGGAALGNVSTDATGTYTYNVTYGSSHTLIATRTGYSFTPASQGTSIYGNTSVTFTGVSGFKISGYVNKGGVQLPGVVMYAGALGTTVTNAGGYYEFNGVPSGTNYLILPAIDAHEFSPVQSGGTLSGNTNLNFTATASTRTVNLTGRVTISGAGLANVRVYGGSTLGNVYTNASGNYAFSGVRFNTPLTITPVLAGYNFVNPSAFVIANNNWINNFTASIATTSVNTLDPQSNVDTDGDGVTDAQELADGTNAHDRGSAHRALGNEICGEWNGFLGGMFNILEHTNVGETPLEVKTTLFSQDGEAKGTRSFNFNSSAQYDVLVHDIAGWTKNSYGRVCSAYSGTSGSLDGRMVYYKPDTSSDKAIGDSSFEFALAMPFESGTSGSQFVSFNTFPPGLAAGDELKFVANWLQITSDSKVEESATLIYYDEKGAELGKDEFRLAAGARKDFAAHRFGRYQVGLAELRPTNPAAKFQLRNVRYVYNNPGSKDSFDTAFQLEGSVGSGQLLSAPVDTRSRTSAVLEMANTTSSETSVIAKVYDENGTLIRSFEESPIRIKAHGTSHLIVSNFLKNATGVVTVQGDGPSSVIATLMEYGRRADGSLTQMYGIRAVEALGATLRGSYNTYLKQTSTLWIVNPTNENETATLSMSRSDSTSLVENKQVNVPARGLVAIDLNTYERSNEYGTVNLIPSHANTLSSWVTRARGDEFVVPTPVR